jgi:hypothetical protein
MGKLAGAVAAVEAPSAGASEAEQQSGPKSSETKVASADAASAAAKTGASGDDAGDHSAAAAALTMAAAALSARAPKPKGRVHAACPAECSAALCPSYCPGGRSGKCCAGSSAGGDAEAKAKQGAGDVIDVPVENEAEGGEEDSPAADDGADGGKTAADDESADDESADDESADDESADDESADDESANGGPAAAEDGHSTGGVVASPSPEADVADAMATDEALEGVGGRRKPTVMRLEAGKDAVPDSAGVADREVKMLVANDAASRRAAEKAVAADGAPYDPSKDQPNEAGEGMTIALDDRATTRLRRRLM